jgi:hypothetical protein
MAKESATKKISPVTILVMLRKAKTKYQTAKVDPKSDPEKRHDQLVVELKKLRDIAKAADKGQDKESAFKLKRKELAKLMRKHWEQLNKEKPTDPNKPRVDRYRVMMALMTLKVKTMQLKAAEEAGEEKDEEAADAEHLENEVVDLTVMNRPDAFDQDEPDPVEDKAPTTQGTTAPPTPPSGGPKPPPGPTSKPTTEGPKVAPAQGKFVALQQARLAWDAARKKVAAEIKALQAKILETFKGDADFPQAVAAAQSLQQKWTDIDGRLYSKLEEGLNAADPKKREACHDEAGKLIDECLSKVTGDDVLKTLDANPFVPVTVFKTLNSTLGVLSTKLKA